MLLLTHLNLLQHRSSKDSQPMGRGWLIWISRFSSTNIRKRVRLWKSRLPAILPAYWEAIKLSYSPPNTHCHSSCLQTSLYGFQYQHGLILDDLGYPPQFRIAPYPEDPGNPEKRSAFGSRLPFSSAQRVWSKVLCGRLDTLLPAIEENQALLWPTTNGDFGR